MKKTEKLHAYYSKNEDDIIVYHPLGVQTSSDAGYMCSNVFTSEFRKEMEKRGYDITTLKFEICPKLPNKNKFKTLTEKYFNE